MAPVVKNLPANAGDVGDVSPTPGPGRSSGGGHGSHSSILAWEIPWAEELSELCSPRGCKELDKTEQLNTNKLFIHLFLPLTIFHVLTYDILRQ